MPNHVFSGLRINGKRKRIQELLAFANGEGPNGEQFLLDVNKFIPYPENFKQLDAAGSNSGVEWRISNSGEPIRSFSIVGF